MTEEKKTAGNLDQNTTAAANAKDAAIELSDETLSSVTGGARKSTAAGVKTAIKKANLMKN